jgi:hypothetical protein
VEHETEHKDTFAVSEMVCEEVSGGDVEGEKIEPVKGMFDIVSILMSLGEGEMKHMLIKLFKKVSVELLEELIHIIEGIKESKLE